MVVCGGMWWFDCLLLDKRLLAPMEAHGGSWWSICTMYIIWTIEEVCGSVWLQRLFQALKKAGTTVMFAKTTFFPHYIAPKGPPLKLVKRA